jgi:hypothetical protein
VHSGVVVPVDPLKRFVARLMAGCEGPTCEACHLQRTEQRFRTGIIPTVSLAAFHKPYRFLPELQSVLRSLCLFQLSPFADSQLRDTFSAGKVNALLERSYRNHGADFRLISSDARFDDYRRQPRFSALIAKANLP